MDRNAKLILSQKSRLKRKHDRLALEEKEKTLIAGNKTLEGRVARLEELHASLKSSIPSKNLDLLLENRYLNSQVKKQRQFSQKVAETLSNLPTNVKDKQDHIQFMAEHDLAYQCNLGIAFASSTKNLQNNSWQTRHHIISCKIFPQLKNHKVKVSQQFLPRGVTKEEASRVVTRMEFTNIKLNIYDFSQERINTSYVTGMESLDPKFKLKAIPARQITDSAKKGDDVDEKGKFSVTFPILSNTYAYVGLSVINQLVKRTVVQDLSELSEERKKSLFPLDKTMCLILTSFVLTKDYTFCRDMPGLKRDIEPSSGSMIFTPSVMNEEACNVSLIKAVCKDTYSPLCPKSLCDCLFCGEFRELNWELVLLERLISQKLSS